MEWTMFKRNGETATVADVRRAILAELRRYGPLFTSDERILAADAAITDAAWLRSRNGQYIGATGRDAVDYALARKVSA